MLQLKVKDVDIVRITKILSNHSGKKYVSNHTISLYGKVSDELFKELLDNIEIISVQNFPCDVKWLETLEDEKSNNSNNEPLPDNALIGNDLLFPNVKRGTIVRSCSVHTFFSIPISQFLTDNLHNY